MADAIDNLVQDINQNNTSVDAMYPLGYENYYIPRPDDFGVPQELNQTGDRWIWDARNPEWGYYNYAQNLSNPSTLATGGEIDYNIPDDPTIRTNIGNTDEKDAFIGGVYTPQNQQQYITGGNVLVPPGDLGGTIGVVDANPSDFAGQTPSSLPEEFITRGETVKIPGRGLPDYIPIGQMENGDVLYADRNNLRDTIIRPSAYSISQEDLDKGIVPQKFNFGINTELAPSQKTPTSVGATEPSTTSEGGFDNTGGNVTVGPGGVTAGPGGTTNVTPGYIPKPEVKPGDEFKDSPWTIASGNPPRKPIVTPEGVTEGTVVPGTGGIKVGDYYPDDQGNKWNWEKGVWEKDPAQGGTKTPPVTTPPVTTPPVIKPPVVTPPGGGTPSGGGQPGRGPTITPPREPVTPLVRRETVIPTKGTKEVPLPDRQADPFAKLYADLLANAQQQKDQYRYINYDPDQIMNAAMSGFRRRGAMRSLQGY